jgi:apolipoprotein N-acyltransferase
MASAPSWLGRVAAWLETRGGWRRYLVAALLGALATAAMPPIYAIPVLIPAFAGLLWQMAGCTRARAALALGWWFGFGHFVTGLYWVGIGVAVEIETFWWFLPFATAGLSALLAAFTGLAVLATWASGWRGPARVVLLAAAWVLAEWLRSWVLTGFPWNLTGSVWTVAPETMQLAAATGVWGLSLVTLVAAGMPAVLAERQGARAWLPVGAGFALVALMWAGGAARLAAAPEAGSATVPGVRLRIVQANIAQDTKWSDERRIANFERHLFMSRAAGPKPITHVIWPETAAAFVLEREAMVREMIGMVAPPGGVVLTGAPRATVGEDGARRIWNSLQVVDAAGTILASYDKFHLVPFGEYVPGRGLLPMDNLTAGRLDFSSGPGPRTLRVPGLPAFGPLICYEVIFPGSVVDHDDRPQWILNITNDTWFGDSTGPYQHFAAARMRALEEGLPLVRAANSGISGVVDGYGRVLSSLELNRAGVLDAGLPEPAGVTMFARLGNLVLAPLLAAALVIAWLLAAADRRSRGSPPSAP